MTPLPVILLIVLAIGIISLILIAKATTHSTLIPLLTVGAVVGIGLVPQENPFVALAVMLALFLFGALMWGREIPGSKEGAGEKDCCVKGREEK